VHDTLRASSTFTALDDEQLAQQHRTPANSRLTTQSPEVAVQMPTGCVRDRQSRMMKP